MQLGPPLQNPEQYKIMRSIDTALLRASVQFV